MEEQIAQILMQFLQRQEEQLTFLTQLSADLAALKNVVFALDARALALFEKRLQMIRDKQRQQIEVAHRETESLIQLISKLMSLGPN